MGIPLPATGDIKTLPSSIPPVPGTCAVTGAVGADATGGGVTGVFLAAVFFGSVAGVFSCF